MWFLPPVVCFDNKLHSQEPVIYRAKRMDEDAAQIFQVELFEENIKTIHEQFEFTKKVIFTQEDRQTFNAKMSLSALPSPKTKTKLVSDNPVYCGMSILDINKTLMYDFLYNYIKEKNGDRAKLLFTDTDNLTYEIETKDFYKDMGEGVDDNVSSPQATTRKIPCQGSQQSVPRRLQA
ncbi:hypothetical protein AWC38_SpisGene23496 [Stylophora pistillata]|uniref:Uncharacterized protein n=1 Tax=Stylophora pistillata TaxID=50429 RepID=A0A2B4R4I4_STYPI|nr:hypothetical protein AWC38_SpisGene23496 [Stylophora pistillata]